MLTERRGAGGSWAAGRRAERRASPAGVSRKCVGRPCGKRSHAGPLANEAAPLGPGLAYGVG